MDLIYMGFQPNRDVPIPLYYQIKTFLEEQIQKGALEEGDLIPPEEELAEYWNISRSTIRKAFTDLAAEGYVDRLKAKGTFVTKPKIKGDFIQEILTYDQEMKAKGFRPKTKALSTSVIESFPEIRERLELGEGDKLIELERLRYADDEPVVYVRSFLPMGKYPKLLEVDWSEVSLYESLFQLYGIEAVHAKRQILAVSADKNVSELLGVKPNAPLLYTITTTWDQHGNPFECSMASYRSDLYSLVIDLKRKD